jgi:DNA-binding winged helix-turn-helix (wHTH) protein/dienelactone hydrolase
MLTDSEGDYPLILRIGDYRVDAAIDEISRDGVVCKLEPRGMSLLLCLARHAGQVVSVDRLLEEVWKDVVVNPDSVYQTVATLRRTLRDDAKNPQYIANVVRRGYRLIAPVSVWEGYGTASSTDGSVVVTDQRESAEVRIAEGPATPLPAEVQSVSAGPDRPGKTSTEAVAAPQPWSVRWSRRSAVLGGVTLGAVIVAGIALGAFWRVRDMQAADAHARNVLLPAIEEALATSPQSDARLLDMALEAEKALPHDHRLAKLWPLIATTLTIETQPAGAGVYWKDYGSPDAPWRLAGVTPLKDARVPRSLLRVEVRKEGFETVELASPRPWNRASSNVPRLTLDPVGSLPTGMVRIPASVSETILLGLEKYGGVKVPEFLADKYEVTNRQYKAFVDAGGYTNASFWRFPIIEAGKEIQLAAARARFIDRTGRPGPATWEAGTFPDGLADHPVTGVSWYEAAAYAAWADKQLPTVYHWLQLADTERTEFLLRFSNFDGKATTAAGSLPGLSSYGIYDIAGNAREWVLNATNNSGQRYILGGGYTDRTYTFNDGYAQPALDRSSTNGFRCIREPPKANTAAELTKPLSRAFRDFTHEQPVDDRTFAQFARQFVYDHVPLDVHIDKVVDTDDWKLEVVSVNAAYNGQRLPIYVFLPLHGTPPYQSVLLFPGSDGFFESHFDPHWIEGRRDYTFIMKSGRALVLPIYKSTFERQDSLHSELPDESVAYKDNVVMWGKDVSRAIDYLEARKDMRADRVAYLGVSWGGFLGAIMPAIEKRIRVVVLNVGGMAMEKALPEVDQINYLPRVTQPVLMLNGEHDHYFPLETAQKPLYRLLGTPLADKKMIVYPSGHLVPRVEFMKETLAWLDEYLGPAQQAAQ